METKKFIRLSMLLAISIILNLIENLFPFLNGTIPGVKIGLANIIIIYVLFTNSFMDALYVSILRVIIVGLLRTGLFSITFIFSLIGAIISLLSMALFKKITKLSIVGISIIGSVFHSLGQIICSIILLNNIHMIYYFPFILLVSIPTGIVVGIISKTLIDNTKDIL